MANGKYKDEPMPGFVGPPEPGAGKDDPMPGSPPATPEEGWKWTDLLWNPAWQQIGEGEFPWLQSLALGPVGLMTGAAAYGTRQALKPPDIPAPTIANVPGHAALPPLTQASYGGGGAGAAGIPGLRLDPEADPMELVPVGSSTTTTRQRGIRDRPEHIGQLQISAERHKTAAQQAAKAQVAGAKAVDAQVAAHNLAMQARVKKHEADVSGQMAKVEEFDAQAAKLRQEIAEMKIDPDNFWSSRTTAQKFSLGLAAALNGFVQGYYGQAGPNPVLRMIGQYIDRDINVQKSKIAAKRGQLGDVRGAMADVYKRIGDMRQAENQTRILMWEQAKMRIDSLQNKTTSEMAAQKMMQAAEMAQVHITKLKMESHRMAQDKVTTSTTVRKAPLMQAMAGLLKMQGIGQGKDLPRPTDPHMKKVEGRTEIIRDLLGVKSKLSRAKYGLFARHIPNTEANRIRQVYITPFLSAARNVIGKETGVMTDRDFNRYKDMLDAKFTTGQEIRERLNWIINDIMTKQTMGLRMLGGYFNVAPLRRQFIEVAGPYLQAAQREEMRSRWANK